MTNFETYFKLYQSKGFLCVPLEQKEKRPKQNYSTDPILEGKPAPAADFDLKNGNIGIATGASGLLVIDCDGQKAVDLYMNSVHFKQTLTVQTRKGLHFYYKYKPIDDKDDKNEKEKKGGIRLDNGYGEGDERKIHIDLQIRKTYVVAPPSKVAREYKDADGKKRYDYSDLHLYTFVENDFFDLEKGKLEVVELTEKEFLEIKNELEYLVKKTKQSEEKEIKKEKAIEKYKEKIESLENDNFLRFYNKYLDLRFSNTNAKTGLNEYKARCPFHEDRTPSFFVNEAGIYNCFGCGAKGNVFDFLRELEKTGKKLDEESKKLLEIRKKERQKVLEKIKDTAKNLKGSNKLINKTEFGRDFCDVYQKMLTDGWTRTASFTYYNERGQGVYIYHRFEKINDQTGEIEKKMIPESTDGRATLGTAKQIPYGLEQFLFVDNTDDVEIWLVEGEKCAVMLRDRIPESCDNVVVLGYKTKNDFENIDKTLLKNKKIVVFEDADEAGKKKADDVTALLQTFAKEIVRVDFNEFDVKGFDVADYLEIFEWSDLAEKVSQTSEGIVDDEKSSFDSAVVSTETENIEDDGWLLDPLIPAKTISILDGIGGTGKSMFALEMCYSLACGIDFLGIGKTTEKTKVLYLNAEETKNRLFKRIKNIAQHYPETKNFVWLTTLDEKFKLTSRLFEKDFKQIKQTRTVNVLNKLIEKYESKLVVFDSLVNFYGLDENSTEDAFIFYEFLKNLIKNYGCSVLLLHHQNKEAMKNGSSGAGSFRGSSVFREQARTRITMSRVDNKNTKKIEIEKSNYHSDLLDEFPIFLKFVDGVWQRVEEPKKKTGGSDNQVEKKTNVRQIKSKNWATGEKDE